MKLMNHKNQLINNTEEGVRELIAFVMGGYKSIDKREYNTTSKRIDLILKVAKKE